MRSELENKVPQDRKKEINKAFNHIYTITDEEINDLDSSTNFFVKNKQYRDELNDIFSKMNNDDKFVENIEKTESLDEATERLKMDKQTVDLFCQNILTDIMLKKRFSMTLLALLCAQLITINGVFILKGYNVVNYSENIFNIYISGSLIEVIALVAIIVKYLFKDHISESLNNILEKNKNKNN